MPKREMTLEQFQSVRDYGVKYVYTIFGLFLVGVVLGMTNDTVNEYALYFLPAFGLLLAPVWFYGSRLDKVKIVRGKDKEPLDDVLLKLCFKVLLIWETVNEKVFQERKAQLIRWFEESRLELGDEGIKEIDYEKLLSEARQSELKVFDYSEDIYPYLTYEQKESIMTLLMTILLDSDEELPDDGADAIADVAISFEFKEEKFLLLAKALTEE